MMAQGRGELGVFFLFGSWRDGFFFDIRGYTNSTVIGRPI
jgi:hypothetical protein